MQSFCSCISEKQLTNDHHKHHEEERRFDLGPSRRIWPAQLILAMREVAPAGEGARPAGDEAHAQPGLEAAPRSHGLAELAVAVREVAPVPPLAPLRRAVVLAEPSLDGGRCSGRHGRPCWSRVAA